MKVEEGIALAAVGIAALVILSLLFRPAGAAAPTTPTPPTQPPTSSGLCPF